MKKKPIFTTKEFDMLFDALNAHAMEIQALWEARMLSRREVDKKQKAIKKLEDKLETL